MAALTIAEPGAPAAAPAVGLDFGTTHSLAALAPGGGALDWVPLGDGPMLPSVVGAPPDSADLLVGRAALALAGQEGAQVLSSVKRLLGRPAAELPQAAQALLCPGGEGEVPRFRLGRGEYSAEELAARIIARVLDAAVEQAGAPPSALVVTVPAYFDEVQRQAVRSAVLLAGHSPDRLIAEPTAAALSVALGGNGGSGGEDGDAGLRGLVAVYDLGGGTFDCSILDGAGRSFEVRASAGDTQLGGDDFDLLLARQAAEQLGLEGLPEGEQGVEFLRRARRAKEELTQAEAAVLAWGGREATLSRAGFEQAAQPLVDKTLALCRRALRDAEAAPGELDGLLMIGGASRIPCVRRALAEALQCEPLAGLDPDLAVAAGAARLAGSLAGLDDAATLVDVTPLSLGIETLGGLVEKVVPRNSPIPLQVRREFTTGADNQTALSLHVLQGERERVEHCRSLARFRLGGLPPAVAGALRIEVCFAIDADGLLQVSATEQQSGATAQVQAGAMNRLAPEEVERMLRDAAASAGEDAAARRRLEALTSAQQLAGHLRAALDEAGHLLREDERAELQAQLAALEALAQDQASSARALEAATERLAEASSDFAHRRMDASLRSAMLGRRAEELEADGAAPAKS